MLVAGGALVGIGVTSVKMAADFQQATLSLVAHAGLATDQINNVSRAVLAMAPTVGRSPIELAEALYPILSAFSGITNQSAKTTLSLSTLKMAFETVAGTTVDGTAVANAAVGTFNALGLATNNAGTNAQRMTNLFDVMDKTVQLGNMTWDQYKNVIAKVATSSNTAHVSFNEASAALATLTANGMNVQKAGTYLVNTFNTLEIKTDLLASRAKKLGISFDEQKYSSMNLADKIKYLNEVTDGNSQKLLALMGNNSTALQTFEKLSTGVNTYRADLDALNHSQGALKSSFDTAAEGFNFHAQQLKAAFDALFINIGTNLLPILSQVLQYVTPLIISFTDWVTQNHIIEQSIAAVGAAIQTMISIGSSVVQFFQQNQLAADALGVAIGMLGGVMALFVASSMADTILSLLEYGLSILTAVAETVTGAAVMTSTFTTMSGMIIASMGAAASSILATLGPFLLAGAVIAAVSIGIVLAVQHWGDIAAWLQTAWSNTLNWFSGALQQTVFTINVVIDWFRQWWGVISATGTALLVFFAPALIIAGAQATASGAVITATFIASLVKTGAAAIVNAAIIVNKFIWSMVATGIEATANAEILVATFIASMVRTGAEAIVNAAKVVYSFVASLIVTGAEGWAAAGKLVPFIAAMIATGYQAVVQAAKITYSFIASLIATANQAYISAYAVTGSFVPALVLMGTQAVAAAGKLLVSLVPALTATGAASWAALGPLGLLAAAIIGLGAVLKYAIDSAQKMDTGVTFNVDDMSTKNIATVDRMRLHLNASTDQMARGVSDSTAKMAADTAKKTAKMAADAAANAHQMDMNVTIAAQSMAAHTLAALADVKDKGGQSFNDLLKQVDMDLSQMDSDAKWYWEQVREAIEKNPIVGHVTYTTAGGDIGVQQSPTTAHNAEGTDNWRGGWSWVGEKGPELMNIPRGAQIIPHDRSIAASSGGGQPVQININLAGHRVAQTLLPDLVTEIRRSTGVRI